ncbi:MAG: NAD-dependent epimerase/dehydratase family protein [DPANN group archaeon]|nr:NAD-dependent epimerase/dehydratase family protein [DPANN group archaeon]
MSEKKVIVTGGVGFIGVHLVKKLLDEGCEVLVLDKYSSSLSQKPKLKCMQVDLLTENIDSYFTGIDEVYHLAANSDVRLGADNTKIDFDQNVVMLYKILEACRKAKIKSFVFTSSSVVYGNASVIPTPEDYGPLLPISMYGGSKLAGEALVSTYANMFGIKSTIVRFANVIGPGTKTHGVIADFIKKLTKNPYELEILGNGKQKKSYLYIDDCIDGMIYAKNNQKNIVDAFNIGSKDQVDVTTLANVVAGAMGLKEVKFNYTGSIGGWKGDVVDMLLSIDKLEKLGWTPKYDSLSSIKSTVKELLLQKDIK